MIDKLGFKIKSKYVSGEMMINKSETRVSVDYSGISFQFSFFDFLFRVAAKIVCSKFTLFQLFCFLLKV